MVGTFGDLQMILFVNGRWESKLRKEINMTIEYDDGIILCPFNDFKIGDCFRYNSISYMRTDEIKTTDRLIGKVNCVRLVDGILCQINPVTIVEKLNAKVVVERS